MKIIKKFIVLFMCLSSIASLFSVSVTAENGVTITTTLVNNSVQKGSKKTFDVIARDKNGKKISSSVTLNGENVKQNWDDSEKTSYTLEFKDVVENVVIVSALNQSVSYKIFYKKANFGEKIGRAVFSFELFSLGKGYLIEPQYVDIYEGENLALAFIKFIHSNGYTLFYGGDIENSLYVSYISNGDNQKKKYNRYSNSKLEFSKYEIKNPKNLKIEPKVSDYLKKYLEENMSYFNLSEKFEGYLGEMNYTNGSGFMYSVNNIFPNVSLSQIYLEDGDVFRFQYTLCYGSDIGGNESLGDENSKTLYPKTNKSALTALLAETMSKNNINDDVIKKYNESKEIISRLDVSQDDINLSFSNLLSAINKNNIKVDTKSDTDGNIPPSNVINSEANKDNDLKNNSSSENIINRELYQNNSKNDVVSEFINQDDTDSADDVSDNDNQDITISKKENKNHNKTNKKIIILMIIFLLIGFVTGFFIIYFKTKNREKSQNEKKN